MTLLIRTPVTSQFFFHLFMSRLQKAASESAYLKAWATYTSCVPPPPRMDEKCCLWRRCMFSLAKRCDEWIHYQPSSSWLKLPSIFPQRLSDILFKQWLINLYITPNTWLIAKDSEILLVVTLALCFSWTAVLLSLFYIPFVLDK